MEFVKDQFIADDGDILGLRLRNQHTVKWVFMFARQQSRALPVLHENLKTSPIEEVLENFHVTRDQVEMARDFASRQA